MKTAAFAVALVYLVSFVTADQPTAREIGTTSDQATVPGLRGSSPLVPGGVITNTIDAKTNNALVSNVALSKSDRVHLANVIKEMLVNNPEANQIAANLMLDQLEQDGGSTGTSTVTNVATNRAVISHAVNILASAISGNPAAAAGHTVGLISAAYPVVMTPVPSPVATRYTPSITITMSPAARGVIPRATPRFFPASPSS